MGLTLPEHTNKVTLIKYCHFYSVLFLYALAKRGELPVTNRLNTHFELKLYL